MIGTTAATCIATTIRTGAIWPATMTAGASSRIARNAETRIRPRADARSDIRSDRRDLANDQHDIAHDQGDITRDRADIRSDHRDIAKDRVDIRSDEKDLRGDYAAERNGADKADISRDRADIQSDRRDIAKDHADIRSDQQDLRADTRDARSDRHDLRSDRETIGTAGDLFAVTAGSRVHREGTRDTARTSVHSWAGALRAHAGNMSEGDARSANGRMASATHAAGAQPLTASAMASNTIAESNKKQAS